MPVASNWNLTAGLHTGPGEAGRDHLVKAVNAYSHQGRMKKRDGMGPIRAVVGPKTTPYVGWGTTDTEPSTVVNAASIAAGATDTALYFGASSAFFRAVINGNSGNVVSPVVQELYDLIPQYWNGTAWVSAEAGHVWTPERNDSFDIHTPIPYVAYDPGALRIVDDHINIMLRDKDDWVAKTIGGQNLFWMRVIGWTAGQIDAATAVLANCFVHTTKNQILHVNTWIDRGGEPHEFVVFLYGGDGTELRYVLDGTELTPSAGLAPDAGTTLFSADTKVDSFYHSATNRLIGRVQDHTWFFLLTNGNGLIFDLVADPVGADTPHEDVDGGLRAAIPDGDHIAVHDGRVFAAVGQKLIWSQGDVFPDIWPNFNEIDINDGKGEITGLLTFAGVLVATKRKAVYNIQTNGTADGYDAVPFQGGVGALGGAAEAGNFALWFSEDGIWQYDGGDAVKLSGAIDETFLRGTVSSDLRKAKGVYHSPLNQYRVFMPSTAEEDAFDKAFYVDLTGYSRRVRGEQLKELSIWPQGKRDDSDYGFQATAVHQDVVSEPPRTLVGDQFGVLHQLDTGLRDAGTPVKLDVTQAPFSLGRMMRIILTWVNTTFLNTGKDAWTHSLLTETEGDVSTDVTVDPLASGDLALVDNTTLVDDTSTVQRSADMLSSQVNFFQRVRYFQTRIQSLVPRAMEWVGFEAEANQAGRRAQ